MTGRQSLRDESRQMLNWMYPGTNAFMGAVDGWSFLTHSQLKELGAPYAGILEQYKDVWTEDINASIFASFLQWYYIAIGELDKCLAIRTEYYEKTGDPYFEPAEHTMTSTSETGESAVAVYDKYGLCIWSKRYDTWSRNGQEWSGDREAERTFNADGRLARYAEFMVATDGGDCMWNSQSDYEYDSQGRLSKHAGKSREEGSLGDCHIEETIWSYIYEYTGNGYIEHVHQERYQDGELVSEEKLSTAYEIDQYGETINESEPDIEYVWHKWD